MITITSNLRLLQSRKSLARSITLASSHRSISSLHQRTPKELAERVVATQLLLSRWGMESIYKTILSNPSSPQQSLMKPRIEDGYQTLTKTLEKTHSTIPFTRREKLLLFEKELGAWCSTTDMAEIEARWESFGMLLWMLRLETSIPRYDVEFSRTDLFAKTGVIPSMPETCLQFIKSWENRDKNTLLRSLDEQTQAINIAEAYYWRSRAQIILNLKRAVEASENSTDKEQPPLAIPKALKPILRGIDSAIAQASERALADGLITDVVDGDFGVLENSDSNSTLIAYKTAPMDRFDTLEKIAEFRMGALGWISELNDWEWERGELKFVNPVSSIWAPKEDA